MCIIQQKLTDLQQNRFDACVDDREKQLHSDELFAVHEISAATELRRYSPYARDLGSDVRLRH